MTRTMTELTVGPTMNDPETVQLLALVNDPVPTWVHVLPPFAA